MDALQDHIFLSEVLANDLILEWLKSYLFDIYRYIAVFYVYSSLFDNFLGFPSKTIIRWTSRYARSFDGWVVLCDDTP